jgi:exopolysaccharide biosynthesis polyprenyl glycosylphosphotransferase
VSSTPLTELPLDSPLIEALPHAQPAPRAVPRARHLTARQWTWIVLLSDTTMFLAGSVATQFGAPRAGLSPLPLDWMVVFAAILFPVLAARGLYSRRLQSHVLDDIRVILFALTLSLAFVLSLQVLLLGSGDGGVLAREWAFVAVYLVAGRTALHWSFGNAASAGQLNRPTLIVGRGRIGALLAQRLQMRPELGLAPVGFLDKDPLPLDDAETDLPVLGASWDLERVIEEHDVEQVVVAFSNAPDEVMLRLLRRCDELGVDVAFVPRFYERVAEDVAIEHLGGVSLLVPARVDPRNWQFALKYGLDKIVAAALLAVSLPFFLVSALAIRLTMGRPVFFRQTRVGRDGKPFEMLKFRSMRCVDDSGTTFVLPDGLGPGGVEGIDRRTLVGRILRVTNLDELPQLLNVLKGEMSIVGPRPERPEFVKRFEDSVYRYSDRHRVKAGITGWAQVNGLRGRTSIADRAEWDNFYVENFSLWLDFKILLMTAATVTRGLFP